MPTSQTCIVRSPTGISSRPYEVASIPASDVDSLKSRLAASASRWTVPAGSNRASGKSSPTMRPMSAVSRSPSDWSPRMKAKCSTQKKTNP